MTSTLSRANSSSEEVFVRTMPDIGFMLRSPRLIDQAGHLRRQVRMSGSGPIAAPDVCDGTSAVGESRHRIPEAHPLVNRLNLA